MKIVYGYFLFFSLALNAQVTTIQVTYGVTVIDDGAFPDLMKSGKQQVNLLRFVLLLTEKEYSFSIVEQLDNTTSQLEAAQILSGYTAAIYYERNSEYLYQNHNDVLGTYLLKKTKPKVEWTITNETKTIDGFLCYKATTSETIVNPSGTFTVPILAWFAPTVPFSDGPLGIGGLPGLILELQRGNVTFGVKAIMRNSNITLVAPI